MGNDWDTFGREKPYVQRVENPKWADPNRDFPSSYSRGGLNKDVVKHRKKASILYEQWSLTWLNEAYRVLQGGGVIKAFSGTRTFHRLAAAMEQAGFVDIRLEAWCYGSGFPKSLNIGHALEDWKGWGTALKPAWEPVLVGRKK